MSVAIATMGKFIPAVGTGTGEIIYEVGGGNYADLRKKPVVRVEKVNYDKYKKKVNITLLSVKEEDDET